MSFEVGMISLVALVAIVVLLGRLLLSNSNDTKASIAETVIPGGEATSSVREAENSDSARATIMITMRIAPLPDE